MSRIEKVNELIKREISNILLYKQIDDPRLDFVTILSVDVSKDLQHARVRFSTLSQNPKDIAVVTELLNQKSGYVRHLVGGRIKIRYTPQIQFIFDKGLQHAAMIDMKLEEIKKLEKSHE